MKADDKITSVNPKSVQICMFEETLRGYEKKSQLHRTGVKFDP